MNPEQRKATLKRLPPRADCWDMAEVNSDGMPRRVLVVDDDSAIRAVLEMMLDSCSVVTAANGLEALTVLEDAAFDAAIVDVMMPILDGFTVIDAIRCHPRHRDTAVVMLTARGSDADHLHAFSAGADAYVTKPFDPDHLVGLVNVLTARTPRERAEQRSTDFHRAQLLAHVEQLFA